MSDDEKVRRALEDGDYVFNVAPLLAAEVKRLRRAARIVFEADGSETLLDTPERAIEYRKSCLRTIQSYAGQVVKLTDALAKQLAGDDYDRDPDWWALVAIQSAGLTDPKEPPK